MACATTPGYHTVEGAVAGLCLPLSNTSGMCSDSAPSDEALAALFIFGAAIGAIGGAIKDFEELFQRLDRGTSRGVAWDSHEGLALRTMQSTASR